jgi:hypothetical protein
MFLHIMSRQKFTMPESGAAAVVDPNNFFEFTLLPVSHNDATCHSKRALFPPLFSPRIVAEVSAALRGALPVQPPPLPRSGHAGASPLFSRLARKSYRLLRHQPRTLCL